MEIITKSQFKKDIKKLKKQGKDFSKLEAVLEKLLSNEDIDAKYKAHPLVGNWKPCWDIHIEPDWLLIYYIDEEAEQLVLVRSGSHSDLF